MDCYTDKTVSNPFFYARVNVHSFLIPEDAGGIKTKKTIRNSSNGFH
jgi:hypothetical protein